MTRGCATAFAMNGSASIHDFEIALVGQTSEDVEAALPDGRFGSAEETGREWNRALNAETGAGEALGAALDHLAPPEHAQASLLLQAWRARVPVTVHVAIGTDTPHTHPAADPATLGAATHLDFRLFCTLVAGSTAAAFISTRDRLSSCRKSFSKPLSCVRNLGHELRDFTTVNIDFLQHYRPRVNVSNAPMRNPAAMATRLPAITKS